MRRIVKQTLKGKRGLLVFTLFVILFFFTFEVSLLSVSEVSMHRVNLAKNRISADALADTGIEYFRALRAKKPGSIKELFSNHPVVWELVYGEETGERYRFTSPRLLGNGYFILDFYMDGDRVIRAVSTGSSGGVEISRDFAYERR